MQKERRHRTTPQTNKQANKQANKQRNAEAAQYDFALSLLRFLYLRSAPDAPTLTQPSNLSPYLNVLVP